MNHKKVIVLFYYFLSMVLLSAATLVISTKFNFISGYRFFSILSGSMQPAIKTGSLIITKAETLYRENDIITYKINSLTKTHRIVSVNSTNNLPVYATKGDANNNIDLEKPTQKQIHGRMVFALPYLGYISNFAKSRTGFLILMVLPALIIVGNEVIVIKNETKALLHQRKKRELSRKEQIELAVGKKIITSRKIIKKILD